MPLDEHEGTAPIPPGEQQGAWDSPVPRHDCCPLTAGADFKTLFLGGQRIGPFDTAADATAQRSALVNLFTTTSLGDLGDDSAGTQAFYIADTSHYGDPDPDTGIRPFTPGATVMAGDSPAGSGEAGGGPFGVFALVNGDISGLDTDHYTALGNYFKGVYRFRVPLSPAWRAVDVAPVKVKYRTDTQAFALADAVWSPDGDPSLGTESSATLTGPSVGDDHALGGWNGIEGTDGIASYLTILGATAGPPCVGDT